MKTLHLLIIVSSIAISILTYFLLVPVTIIISDEASRIANDTASKYEIFPHETTWYVHITSDGKIKPSSNHDMINENSIFSCSFSVIPNDAKDHFAYLAV
ncbi:MAG TPA: hypothetical protein VFJ23_02320, partial [Candidatus Nitrosotalea sp.]|nr:hypothetical protein [Candidatus Nitrosotalea sp.]